MTEPTGAEIMQALRSAGWLLEQDTLSMFREEGFAAEMGRAYTDPQDGSVSREIDVFGAREYFRQKDVRLRVVAHLIAECKQSTSPYVLIGRPLTRGERSQPPAEHVLRHATIAGRPIQVNGETVIPQHAAWTRLGLDALPGSPSQDTFRATQMTRLTRKQQWQADNEGIFTSLVYPLAKALRSLQGDIRPRGSGRHDRQRDWATVGLFFPMVVTSADICIVDATADEPVPERRPWATMTRELKSQSVSGKFNVDVVEYSHLRDYLDQRVDRFARAVADLAEQEPEEFVRGDLQDP